jgi:sec-independent protein translocase protein TatA
MHTPLITIPLFGMPGMMEWIIIAAVVMLFFGAAKLPKLGKGLGEGIRNFKKGIKGDLEKKEDSLKTTNSKKEDEEEQ